jgi:hypothetical protein
VVTAALTGAEFGCSTCAVQVSALETIVSKGGKVADADVVALTEALMNELVKLDSVAAEGEVKVQRRMQVSRSVKSVSAYVVARRLNFLHGFARAGREARESSIQSNAQPMVVLCRRSGCRGTWRRWTPSARRTRRRRPRPTTAAWTWTATPRPARHTSRRTCRRGGTSSSLPRRRPRRAGSRSTCCRRCRPRPRPP